MTDLFIGTIKKTPVTLLERKRTTGIIQVNSLSSKNIQEHPGKQTSQPLYHWHHRTKNWIITGLKYTEVLMSKLIGQQVNW